jgi:hypothetical protein
VAGNELFNILGRHSWKLGAHYHFAYQDRRVFLARKVDELANSGGDHQNDKNQRQAGGVKSKTCDAIHDISSG